MGALERNHNYKSENKTTSNHGQTANFPRHRFDRPFHLFCRQCPACIASGGETAQAAAPPMWYPGMYSGAYGFDYWRNLYSQVIPYDIYANWVNQNTQFNLPVVAGLPGLPASGST